LHPFLLEIPFGGDVYRIPSYGVMLALAFSAAYFESLRRAAKTGDSQDHVENLFLVVIAASVVGARLFHVLFEEPSYYWKNPAKIFALWEGGYTFYGALLLAATGIFVYCRRKKISFLAYGDIAAPATALGLFLGRLGCFLAGCCWGTPTNVPWGVVFRHPDTFAAVKGIRVHPSQIYEALGGLFIYLYLTWRFKKRAYPGQIFFHGVAIYSVVRFIVERFRGDEYRGFVLGGLVSYSQLVSLSLLPAALFGMWHFSKRSVKG
jgi:phosphatidylglycerol---prolipoprotein diacylglyceryl transferase